MMITIPFAARQPSWSPTRCHRWNRRVAAGVALICGCAAAQTADSDSRESASVDARRRVHLSEIAAAPAPEIQEGARLEASADAAARLSRAQALAGDRDFAAALDELSAAARTLGGDAFEIASLRAAVERALGREDDAIRSARLALRLRADSAETSVLLGELLFARGRSDEAIAVFRGVASGDGADLDPHATVAWLRLGEALEKEGFARAAAQAFDVFDKRVFDTHREHRNFPPVAAVLEAEPLGKLVSRVELYLLAGAPDEAARAAAAGAAQWPDSLVVARLRAESLVAQEKHAEAFAACDPRLDEAGSIGLWPIALKAASGAGKVDALIERVGPRIAAAPAGEAALGFLDALLASGEHAAAARLCEQITSAQGDRADVAVRHAIALRVETGIDSAIERLAAFIRSDAAERGLPVDLLARFVADDDAKRAVRDAGAAAVQVSGTDFARDYVVAVLAAQAGDADHSAALMARANEAKPDYIPALLAPIERAASVHDWERVIADSSAILVRDPEVAQAWFALGEAYDALDEAAWAEEGYKRAIRHAPDAPRYAVALGDLYRRGGELVSAQRYFQQALTADPSNADAYEGLIDSYVLGGKLDLALATYEGQDLAKLPPEARQRADVTARYIRSHDADAYLADLRALGAVQPRDVVAGRLLAARLLAKDLLNEAAAQAEHVLELAPDDTHMRVVLARIAARRASFGEAAKQLEIVRQRFPRRADLLRTLAQYLLYDFQLESCRRVLGTLIDLPEPPAPDARLKFPDRPSLNAEFGADHMALVATYRDFGEFAAGLKLLDEWAPRFGDSEAFFAEKLELLAGAKRKDEVVKLLADRLDASPDDPTLRAQFLAACVVVEAYEPLIARMKEWVDEQPANLKLSRQLAEALIKAGKADEAVELARSWMDGFENDLARTDALINILISAKRYDDAMKAARDFDGNLQQAAMRRIWMGVCQAAAEKYDLAIAEFDALLNERWLDENQRQQVRERLVQVWLDGKLYESGLARCAAWLKDAGDKLEMQIECWSYQRALAQAAGRPSEYESAMERLLAVAPDEPGLMNDLGYTWVDRGANVERATQMIRSALAADPLNAAYLDSLGWAYYLQGRFDEAREQLRRATLLPEGKEPVVFDHLGDAAYRAGDRPAAETAWKRAVASLEELPERRRGSDHVAAAEAAGKKLDTLERGAEPNAAPTAAERDGR